MVRFVLVVLCLFLAGCTTAKLETSFDPQEAAYINNAGRGLIEGQAFLRRNDGIVVYAAGSEVVLIPATRYAEERIRAIFGSRRYASVLASKKFENDDARYYAHTKKTVADGEGRFIFANVAPGRYFVTTSVFWTPNPDSIFPEGGALLYDVTVTDAPDPIRVIMSGT